MSFTVETDSLSDSPNAKYDLSHIALGGPLIRTQLGRLHLVHRDVIGLTGIQSALVGLNAAQSTLSGARFFESHIVQSDFVFVTLRDCYFKGVVFEDCTFRHTRFLRCTFDSCRFSFSRPVAHDDELVIEDCLFLEGTASLRELTLEKEIRFLGCSFQAEGLPSSIKENHFIITPIAPPAKVAAPPKAKTVLDPITPVSVSNVEPVPTTAPAGAPRKADATRFDKLERQEG